jgi:hypothetical protein
MTGINQRKETGKDTGQEQRIKGYRREEETGMI